MNDNGKTMRILSHFSILFWQLGRRGCTMMDAHSLFTVLSFYLHLVQRLYYCVLITFDPIIDHKIERQVNLTSHFTLASQQHDIDAKIFLNFGCCSIFIQWHKRDLTPEVKFQKKIKTDSWICSSIDACTEKKPMSLQN